MKILTMLRILQADHRFQRAFRQLWKHLWEQSHECKSLAQSIKSGALEFHCELHAGSVHLSQRYFREGTLKRTWWTKGLSFDEVKLLHKRFMSEKESLEPSVKPCSDINFAEIENEYFYEYLASFPECRPYILRYSFCGHGPELEECKINTIMERIQNKACPEQIAQEILQLLQHWATVSERVGPEGLKNENFALLVKLIMKHLYRMNFKQVIESMAYISRLGLRNSITYDESRKNRVLLSKSYDNMLCGTLMRLNLQELLLAADFLFVLRGSSFTKFPYLMCEKVKPFLPTMTRPELMLLLFHISACRRTPEGFVDLIMNLLSKDMAKLSLEEVGIINLAHYKTRTLIRRATYFMAVSENLKKRISQDLNPICLAAVLKYQDASLNKCKENQVPQFFAMLEDLVDPLLLHIPTLPPQTLMHVLNLFYSLDLLSESLFLAAVDRILCKGVTEWRLKDMARVTQILSNIPLAAEKRTEALLNITTELGKPDRQKEREKHCGCLLQVAMALSFSGIYPHLLAQEIFSDTFQKAFQGSTVDYRGDLYHLSQSIYIEDTTYQGPFLQNENFPKLAKNKVYDTVVKASVNKTANSRMSIRDWVLVDLMEVLHKVCQNRFIHPVFLLPHFQTADIEITLLRSKNKTEETECTRPFDLDSTDCAVVLHGSHAYQNVRMLEGQTVSLLRQYHAMRPRQLRKLGVSVVEIPYTDFQLTSDRKAYLKQKLAEAYARER